MPLFGARAELFAPRAEFPAPHAAAAARPARIPMQSQGKPTRRPDSNAFKAQDQA